MKDWLINLAAKIGGIGRAWEWMDGKKAYGTGAVAILGGVVQLAAELAPILSKHDTSALLTLATHINSDPAWVAILGGAAVIAGAHKAEKVIAAVKPDDTPKAAS